MKSLQAPLGNSKKKLEVLAAVKGEGQGIASPGARFREKGEVIGVDFGTCSAGFTQSGKIGGNTVAQVHHAAGKAALGKPQPDAATGLRFSQGFERFAFRGIFSTKPLHLQQL